MFVFTRQLQKEVKHRPKIALIMLYTFAAFNRSSSNHDTLKNLYYFLRYTDFALITFHFNKIPLGYYLFKAYKNQMYSTNIYTTLKPLSFKNINITASVLGQKI